VRKTGRQRPETVGSGRKVYWKPRSLLEEHEEKENKNKTKINK
jgi:hypothetical protein